MTTTIDRSTAPLIRDIESINLPLIGEYFLKNGVPLYMVAGGEQEVLKIELLFDAGRWTEPLRAVASTTSKMLTEGTVNKTAQQIAETIDFYGASIHTDASVDYASVTMYTLTKHLDHVLPVLQEIIYQPIFPERELVTYIQNSSQRLLINMEKVDFLAQKIFNEQLYGRNHPNGYTTEAKDYSEINFKLLKDFHQSRYCSGLKMVFASGNVNESIIAKIDNYFGGLYAKYFSPNNQNFTEVPASNVFQQKKDAVQSGIRIGKKMVNKLHPDYVSLRVLNTVLGGYFGSRLMQNLREDHGFCYGVHSGVSSYLHDAHLYITTEVGDEVVWQAVDEIYKEVNRLRTEMIPGEELRLVKNYMLGVFLADADGPFNVSDIVRGLKVYELKESFFYNMIEKIKSVTSEELLQLAVQYFDPGSMLEIVVGNNPRN
ncbi:MAG: insulinase family protein [Chitinophagales bacterium]|nr:insulinase family protein [Chitinophagales bacterium]